MSGDSLWLEEFAGKVWVVYETSIILQEMFKGGCREILENTFVRGDNRRGLRILEG